MAYSFYLENWYAVDASWLYSAANALADTDDDRFEAAIEKTELEREEAVLGMLRPFLTKMGFATEAWGIFTLTEDYIAYEGFELQGYYGREFVWFDADSLFSTAEQLPESKTIQFTRAHEKLVKLLGIEELTAVPMLWMEAGRNPKKRKGKSKTSREDRTSLSSTQLADQCPDIGQHGGSGHGQQCSRVSRCRRRCSGSGGARAARCPPCSGGESSRSRS